MPALVACNCCTHLTAAALHVFEQPLVQTAALALGGPQEVPFSDGGRSWHTVFDDEFTLIEVRAECAWQMGAWHSALESWTWRPSGSPSGTGRLPSLLLAARPHCRCHCFLYRACRGGPGSSGGWTACFRQWQRCASCLPICSTPVGGSPTRSRYWASPRWG